MQKQFESLRLNQTEWPEFKMKNISTVQTLHELTQFLNLPISHLLTVLSARCLSIKLEKKHRIQVYRN
jgi:hypothetical protein